MRGIIYLHVIILHIRLLMCTVCRSTYLDVQRSFFIFFYCGNCYVQMDKYTAMNTQCFDSYFSNAFTIKIVYD